MILHAISDLHGRLPEIDPCDVLVIAGDVCPDFPDKFGKYFEPRNGADDQLAWLETNFAPWLKQIPADCVIGIAGNHDFVFQEYPLSGYELPWNYLCDEEIEVDGVTFHGTPWVPGLPRWAFSADDEKLEKAYAAVPAYAHVLISHGPPYGCRDLTVPHFGSRRVGSKPLAQRLKDGRLAPQVLVCGHIHEGYGREKIGNTIVYNVAHVDEAYSDRVKPPLQIWEAE